jgi:hypothetical protein
MLRHVSAPGRITLSRHCVWGRVCHRDVGSTLAVRERPLAKQTGSGSRHEPVPHHNAKVPCSALGSLGPFPILQVSTRIVLTIAVLELTPDPLIRRPPPKCETAGSTPLFDSGCLNASVSQPKTPLLSCYLYELSRSQQQERASIRSGAWDGSAGFPKVASPASRRTEGTTHPCLD